jgi:hypothetical protein
VVLEPLPEGLPVRNCAMFHGYGQPDVEATHVAHDDTNEMYVCDVHAASLHRNQAQRPTLRVIKGGKDE